VDRVIKWRKIWITWGCSSGIGDVVASKLGWMILGTFCPWGSSIGPLFWIFGFGGFGSTKRSSIFEVWFLELYEWQKEFLICCVSISKLWWRILKSSRTWGSYASPLVWTLWIYWEYVFTKKVFLFFCFWVGRSEFGSIFLGFIFMHCFELLEVLELGWMKFRIWALSIFIYYFFYDFLICV
jgi:hypothetical protein